MNLHALPDEVLREVLALTEAKKRLDLRDKVQNDFMAFAHHVYDNFIEGRHHRIIAEKLERVARGELKRLIINMPPRHSKSEFASYLMPAWFLGRNPKLKIIQATHNTELAVRFGRKVRDLINDPRYIEAFPNTLLKEDNKGAGKWGTSVGGEYFAAGVGAAVTGRGADLFIIDDPHSEQDALSETAYDMAYEWYTSGPRQRLQPGGSIILVMTRWGKKDLTGRLLAAQGSDIFADQWEVVEFPAIMPSGEPLWPEFWDKSALLGIKASLPVAKWSAQWQQQPTGNESAIIRREWWKMWDKEDIPELKYIIQSYDTAFSKKETADFSAITTWGIFQPTPDSPDNIILLDAQRGRWSFPELKEVAWEEHQYWNPDMVIIEAKAAGMPLIDEMRLRGIPALGFSPGRKAGRGGMDKITRMNLVSPLFEAGVVWAPQDKKFSDEVIEEVASFPYGDHDDFCLAEGTLVSLADGTTRAIENIRVGDMVSTPLGPKPVLDARFTGVKPLWEIHARGQVLRGTENHLLATTSGWKRLDTVTVSDTVKLSHNSWSVQCLLQKIQTWFRNAFSLLEDPIAGTQTLLTGTFESTTPVPVAIGFCTKTSGSTTMGLSQRGTTSTTRMETARTTTLKTYAASQELSIGKSMQKNDVPTAFPPRTWSIWHSVVKKLSNGTKAMRVARGIGLYLRRSLTAPVSSWLLNENTNATTRSHVLVKSVARRFRRLLGALSFAHRRAPVEKVVETGVRARVYDLTVADAHCFYASGMLVHNCDSMTLALLRFRQGGFVSLIGDDVDDGPSTFSVKEYY
jgi:predicted phage terminase large subunit-like protein